MKSSLLPLIQSMRAAWKPQDNRTPWEWCEDFITVDNTSPFPGKWRSNTSPWVKEVMEAAADRTIKKVSVRCAAQSSKTQTILNLLCYMVCEDPGPTMYVMANQVDAEDFVRDRVTPTVHSCKPAAANLLRETKASFTFSTMPLYFIGAGSTSKLQGKPMKRLFLDEVRNWPKGALATVEERVTAFSQLGAQIFMISTPGLEDDAVDKEFKKGDQRTFHFPCPKCGKEQQLKLAQLRWNTNEETKPGGFYNFDALRATIRYECENAECKHAISDTPAERKAICRTGRFIKMNPNAPKNHASFTWNALLPWWVSWGDLVEGFLNARAAARLGDTKPMFTFVTEKLGEPWKDALGVIEDFGFLEARKADYDFGEPWPEEVARFMAADRGEAGGEHYWWIVRAFGQNGKSRLIAHGRALTTAELEQERVRWNVPKARACIDSGWKASEVYRFCISTGWHPFKGEPNAEYFLKRIQTGPTTFKTIRRIWERTFVDPFIKNGPKSLALFRHVGNETKDLLAEFTTGLRGEWTLPKGIGREYLKHLTGERRREHTDPKGRVTREWHRVGPNHYFDCEIICLICAVVTKLITEKSDSKPAEQKDAIGNVPTSLDGTHCDTRQAGQAAPAL